jgi:hypothetical protein
LRLRCRLAAEPDGDLLRLRAGDLGVDRAARLTGSARGDVIVAGREVHGARQERRVPAVDRDQRVRRRGLHGDRDGGELGELGSEVALARGEPRRQRVLRRRARAALREPNLGLAGLVPALLGEADQARVRCAREDRIGGLELADRAGGA